LRMVAPFGPAMVSDEALELAADYGRITDNPEVIPR
jgi:hypothetical protein